MRLAAEAKRWDDLAEQSGQPGRFDTSNSLPQPEVHQDNIAAVEALLRVLDCRHHTVVGLGGANWLDVRAVLDLHDQWCPDTQERLAVIFRHMVAVEAREREEKAERDAAARTMAADFNRRMSDG